MNKGDIYYNNFVYFDTQLTTSLSFEDKQDEVPSDLMSHSILGVDAESEKVIQAATLLLKHFGIYESDLKRHFSNKIPLMQLAEETSETSTYTFRFKFFENHIITETDEIYLVVDVPNSVAKITHYKQQDKFHIEVTSVRIKIKNTTKLGKINNGLGTSPYYRQSLNLTPNKKVSLLVKKEITENSSIMVRIKEHYTKLGVEVVETSLTQGFMQKNLLGKKTKYTNIIVETDKESFKIENLNLKDLGLEILEIEDEEVPTKDVHYMKIDDILKQQGNPHLKKVR